MLIIRCGDKIDNYYLYQVLRSKWFYNQILSIQSGSAQPQLPKSHFLKMTIPMPNMNTQHKIAGVLSSIGNKISVNTAINENLRLKPPKSALSTRRSRRSSASAGACHGWRQVLLSHCNSFLFRV